MAAAPSVLIKKTAPFKAGVRTYSNRYHFTGGTPSDDTHWHTLFDAIVAAEKACYPSWTTIVEAVGYAAGSDVPVSTKNYTTIGTLSAAAGGINAPLESVALIRWSTTARSTKNHPIYAFSYMRPAYFKSTDAWAEQLDLNQKSALLTYATSWVTGFSDGSITAVRATPSGHTCNGQIVEEFLTHRDFPYTPSL